MELWESIITAIVTISGLVFGYLKVVVPEREKRKAARIEKDIEKSIAERERYKAETAMWKEQAKASDARAVALEQEIQLLKMEYKYQMFELSNAFETIETFNTDPNVAKVIAMLKPKIRKKLSIPQE